MKRIPKPLLIMLPAGAAFLSLPSCNGLFNNLYDEPAAATEFGFIKTEQATGSGTIYIDATSYTKWTYIDFDTFSVDTTQLAADGSETGHVTEGWDFAVHRYDTKTNAGAVIETRYTSLDDFLAAGELPDGEYVEDIWTENRITVDISQMMDGNIIYAPSWYNPELSKWLNVDTSTMPPLYTMSGKVYVLMTQNGQAAALLLTNYMNDSKIKGYMTIDYIYPVEFRQ